MSPLLLRPTALEIASGVVLGRTATVATESGPPIIALDALRQSILPALQRPPCLVSFSGGMDSSLVLAVAADVARRSGLPAPIPVTWRFTGAPLAEESSWQDRVITALGINEWQHLHADDDLDLVGPVARRSLCRYGVLSPFNMHLHLPILELARGGSLLTGLGGDQVLSSWRERARRSPWHAARASIPGRLAAAVRQRRQHPWPWLRPEAARQVLRLHRTETLAEPHSLDRRVAWHASSRSVLMTRSSLQAMASDNGVQLIHPLLDPQFVAALGRHAAVVGSRTRAELLHDIAGDALPPASIAFRPKAHFLEVFLRRPTHDFVRSWDGCGLDENLVDVGILRQLWKDWPIPAGTGGLIQQLSIARAPRSPWGQSDSGRASTS